jgi:hypothetical protein
MRILDLGRRAFIVSVTIGMLAGCRGGPLQTIGSQALLPQAAPAMQDADRGVSWMAPNASRVKELLYVSDDASDDVYVYDYKALKLLGLLKGLRQPYGQCVDAHGNIWITDLTGQQVVEYAHGSIHWKKQLKTQGASVGCSVDPTSGNLAVANVKTTSSGGNIRVFSSSGYHDYSNGACYYLEQPGYDAAGNLYVEAYSSSNVVNVCELPRGGNSLTTVSVSQQIYAPSSVMWDGKYLTLADVNYNDSGSTAIYRTGEDTSGNLTVVGTTVLTDTCDGGNAEVWQPFIVGTQLVGFDTNCAKRQRISIWTYPTGGDPSKALPDQPRIPEGNAVSIVSK